MAQRRRIKSETTCTCPCLDCIEGRHCGGICWSADPRFNDKAEIIGVCHEGPEWGYGPEADDWDIGIEEEADDD